MKKIIAILLVLTMMFTLVACGDKEEKKDTEGPKTSENGGEENNGGNKEIAGETYNVGNFTVLVPEGWLEIAVDDMWSDAGATDPNKVQIIKDGASEFDILTKAYIQIDYYGSETDMMAPSSEWYEGAVDLEPIVTGDITWNGFSAVSGGNNMVALWTGEAGGPQYQATLWCNGEYSISVTDADVLAILASVKPAA